MNITEKTQEITEEIRRDDGRLVCAVCIRFGDDLRNGAKTFSITGHTPSSAGTIHDQIAEHFPQYAHLIKWHLVSTDGPLHYVANAVWHAGEGPNGTKKRNLDAARKTAVWPDATDEDLLQPGLEDRLWARLPQLMKDFRQDMEGLGFSW